MKNKLVLILALFSTASLGLSQSSGGDTGASSTANSGSNANINFVNKGSSQLITAFPGAGTPVFPGFASENNDCYAYKSVVDPVYSMAVLRARAKHAKFDKHHVDWSVGFDKADAISENDDPIAIVEYNPDFLINPGDKKLGSGVILGKYLGNDDGLIAVALLEGKKKTHMRRAAMVFCYEKVNVTKASSWGIGGGGAGAAGSTNSEALSLGYSRGSSTSAQQKHLVLHVIAMNDNGGVVKRPVVKNEPPPEPPKVESQPTPAIQQLPVQTIRIEVVGAQPAPQLPAPPAAAMTPTINSSECDLPEFVVNFDFDKSIVHDEYIPKIASMATWLKTHPACTVQVEGHASKEASFNYNAALGRRRSKAVYDLLMADCDADTQKRVLQFVSAGKDFPASEYLPGNRRVILRVVSKASGK